ncbi:hypothetical protein J1N35_038023 [Gossypium stocksii]|uniref:Uncharacterized protein n=1 Tax=Gossypium stocksii TaxID=47602 RepID=A0A9D3ZM88_9ROSI|nr:hypothetical protein J1N35_038023 [Gossypium stocksii]
MDLSPCLSSVNGDDGDPYSVEDRTTKKVRFKGRIEVVSEDMVVEPNMTSAPSWKDKILGRYPNHSVVDCNISSFGRDSASGGDFDLLTDNRSRGHFARLAVFLNLKDPLISQVLVDGTVQRVEYEALPTVYFGSDRNGHVKDLCLTVVANQTLDCPSEVMKVDSAAVADDATEEMRSEFGPWMLVERRSRRVLMKNGEISDNIIASTGNSVSMKGAGINAEGIGGLPNKVGDKS